MEKKIKTLKAPQVPVSLTAKWPVSAVTTTTATLPPRQPPPVASTFATAAAHHHRVFPRHYQTHFSKPLLLTFSNQSHQAIITIPIRNLRNSTPAIFVPKANVNNRIKIIRPIHIYQRTENNLRNSRGSSKNRELALFLDSCLNSIPFAQ